jgi:hypothetical protein
MDRPASAPLDVARIREVVRKLADALDEPERPEAFERILQRVDDTPS